MGKDDKDSDDQWFKEVYGNGYTGPSSRPLGREAPQDNTKSSRPNANENADKSDEEEEPRDPNAIPTDFTSREAKVWEAKAKAIERNWKRRKEEELKCRICGEWGHFPQGCPLTLGRTRKREEFIERIHVKDKHLKPKLGNVHNIEKDTGCRLKLEDDSSVGNGAFDVVISGSNRFIVSKAVNVVKDLVQNLQDEGSQHGGRSGLYPESSNDRLDAQMLQQKPNLYGSIASYPDDGQNLSLLDAQQQRQAVPFQELNGLAAIGPSQVTDLLIRNRDDALYYGWNQEESRLNHKADFLIRHGQQPLPRTSEELERIFLDEAVELSKQQAAEEAREMDRHREQMRIILEHFEQRGVLLRAKHTEQLKSFLRKQGHPLQEQYQYQTTRDHSVSSGGSQFPSRAHEHFPYEQNDVNAMQNVLSHKAGFDLFHESGPYQTSAYAYPRK